MPVDVSPIVVPGTRYRSLSRGRALAVVALFLVAVALCLQFSRVTVSTGTKRDQGDMALYEHVVARLQAGEPYYDALGAEARQRGYPTNSVFNWRPPLHLEMLSHLPGVDWAQGLLAAGAVAALALAFFAVRAGQQPALAAVQVLVMAAALMLTPTQSGAYFADVWAGVLIAISIGAYGLDWRRSGALFGILALFFRELALPYALISVVFALHQRRRRELLVWLGGFAALGVYYGLHTYHVLSHIAPGTFAASPTLWIQFGGLRVLLMMSRMGLLLGLPLAVTAVYLPLAVLGLCGGTWPLGRRLLATVGAYLILFSVVGLPRTFYWGAIYSPLLAYGVTWALPSCRDLLAVLLAPSESGRT